MNYKLNKLSSLFLGSAIAASTAFGSGTLEKVMKERIYLRGEEMNL